MEESDQKSYFPSILQWKQNESTNINEEDSGLLEQTQLDNFILNSVLPVSMAGSLNHEALYLLREEEMMTGPCMRLHLNLEILTGSSAEGLSLPDITEMKGPLKNYSYCADSDIKFVQTSLIVDNENRKAFARMDSSHSPPCFTRLVFNHDWLKMSRKGINRFNEAKENQILSKPEDYIDKNNFINREKITRILRKELRDHVHSRNKEIRLMKLAKGTIPEITFTHHGPAITADMVDPVSKVMASKDYVLALPCPRWPTEAKEWLLRNRVWPSKKQIKSIVKRGCHIVPKRHHMNKDPCEFIISFSVTEKYVAHCLNINQKRVYILLKMLHKACLNKAHLGLTSYHIKTILFRLCEKVPQENFKEENPLECLQWLLSDLECCLKIRNLPHYFIPECNLIDHISLSSVKCILGNIQKIRSSLPQILLESTETYRFSWLSKDISLFHLIQPTLNSDHVTWKLLKECMLKFVAALLEKGEIHMAISILCGTMNCEILPPTEEIIETVEATVLSCTTEEDIVSIQGLLATLYHQQAMECMQSSNLSQYRQYIGKSYKLFQSSLKKTKTQIWIVGEYYKLLSTQDMHTKLVRHFTAELYKKGSDMNCYQEGIYTVISNHNWLTSDESFLEVIGINEFEVPTTAFLFYKAFKSIVTIAEGGTESQSKRLNMLANKILHDFDFWAKSKITLYPEKIDENIHLLLGLCNIRKGDKTSAEKCFITAANCAGVLSATSDMVLFPVKPIDKVKQMTANDIRAHPYKTDLRVKSKGISCDHIKMSEFEKVHHTVSVLPFQHW